MADSLNLTSKPEGHKGRARVLLVASLLVGMVIVAVQAKTLHYSPKNLQSQYFSASVKIANRAHHDSQQIHRVAVLTTPLELPQLENTEFASRVEREAGRVHRTIEIPQLRSPPVAL
jgi:hypothetical protein